MWPRGFLSRLLLRVTAGATDRHACARIHPLLVKSGHASDTRLATALADAYAKSGLVAHAQRVFDETPRRDLVLWNVMISCYASHGLLHRSWALFASMRSTSGLSGDGFTFSALLSARRDPSSPCSHHLGGLLAHGLVLRLGLHLDLVVTTALLDMYAKCGRVADARRVFDAMLLRNSVSWNAIIVCYGQHGGGKEALQLFVSMLRNDDGCCCRADELTLASLLSSCANMAAAYEATQLHAYALKRGLQGYLQVANALIMAYGKNGFLLQATQTFAAIRNPDIVSWSSMVSSFAYLGCAKSAVHLFERMLHQGVRPDGIAFLGVLSACSHAGLIQDGLKYFLLMTKDYQIDPCPQHLACLVDLLGRAGRLQDAYNVLLSMSCQANTDVIGAFLAACKTRGNIELAKWAADRLLCLEPNESANYQLISNAYAAAGAWSDLAKVRSHMRDMCGNKVPGCSWIEVGGKVQTFVSNDISLQRSTEMQHMMDLIVTFVKIEFNEGTLCKDPDLISEWY
jgi:pentatricopeptide repeat protein